MLLITTFDIERKNDSSNSNGGERMREKIEKEWLLREDFECIKCGAKGKDIGWNDKGKGYTTGQPEEVLFCKKCGHELTTKEELENLVAFVKVSKYSFFLRFAKRDFTPCRHCQEKLRKVLGDCDIILGNKEYEPLIELSRKWEIDNEKQKKLEKGQIIEVNGLPFGRCERCKKERYLKSFIKRRLCFDCDKK